MVGEEKERDDGVVGAKEERGGGLGSYAEHGLDPCLQEAVVEDAAGEGGRSMAEVSSGKDETEVAVAAGKAADVNNDDEQLGDQSERTEAGVKKVGG